MEIPFYFDATPMLPVSVARIKKAVLKCLPEPDLPLCVCTNVNAIVEALEAQALYVAREIPEMSYELIFHNFKVAACDSISQAMRLPDVQLQFKKDGVNWNLLVLGKKN